MLKGAIHIHSVYSDGELTLPELRRVLLAEGCCFACVTDHAEAFDENQLRQYLSECATLSDQNFQFIPGLEYECRDRMHILGYGCTRPISSQDPQEVIKHIQDSAGICVIAHPKDTHFQQIEQFSTLPDGIETWNSKYDGRYAPRPDTFALLHRLRRRRPPTLAFYGQDLHWKKQFRGLMTMVMSPPATGGDILAALRRGDYHGQKGDLRLPSSGELPPVVLARFAQRRRKSEALRSVLKSGKRVLDRWGVPIPANVKANLRKVL
ncbi:MAG TPA: hypothetical protein VKT29_14290 [Terriglobales bacterium]|nr:hypothetical protein [Terriglobales bacterium]